MKLTKSSEKVVREKPIPEVKKEIIKELANNITTHRTVLIASCKGLPGRQFHDIKKKLRGKAEIKVAKKSAIFRAINEIEKGAVKNLKEKIGPDIVILFSDLDPFELSGFLADNQRFQRFFADPKVLRTVFLDQLKELSFQYENTVTDIAE